MASLPKQLVPRLASIPVLLFLWALQIQPLVFTLCGVLSTMTLPQHHTSDFIHPT